MPIDCHISAWMFQDKIWISSRYWWKYIMYITIHSSKNFWSLFYWYIHSIMLRSYCPEVGSIFEKCRYTLRSTDRPRHNVCRSSCYIDLLQCSLISIEWKYIATFFYIYSCFFPFITPIFFEKCFDRYDILLRCIFPCLFYLFLSLNLGVDILCVELLLSLSCFEKLFSVVTLR